MLVIAVVAGVCIKAAKTKLDKIISYTYNIAYSTLNATTKEMLNDFKADEDYLAIKTLKFPFNLFVNSAKAEETLPTYYYCPLFGLYRIKGLFGGSSPRPYELSTIKSIRVTDEIYQESGMLPNCIPDLTEEYISEKFPEYQKCPSRFEGYESYDLKSDANACTTDCQKLWVHDHETCNRDCGSYVMIGHTSYVVITNSFSQSRINRCLHPGIDWSTGQYETVLNNYLNGPTGERSWTCIARPKTVDPPTTGGDGSGGDDGGDDTPVCTPPDDIPCGKKWDSAQCKLVEDIPTCGLDEEFVDNGTVCGCVKTPATLPRKGENFCKLFANYTNTSPSLIDGGEECEGDSISDSDTDFSNKKPDIVLRNGMRLFNLSQNGGSQYPVKINALDGNSNGKTYTDKSDNTVDIDEWGYKVYVDLDGSKGDNELWYDIYPFYITLSGKVFPAYDEKTPGQSGGDSKSHLQTSIMDSYFDDVEGRKTVWHTKSVSFKESACKIGLLNDSTPYCSQAPAYTKLTECSDKEHDCKFKLIKPIKFFGF